MVAQPLDEKPARRPKLGPVGEAGGKPVLDLDPEDVEAAGAVTGTELAPERLDAPQNTLLIRGVEYPVPQIGPMAIVYGSDVERKVRSAQDKLELLQKAGRDDAEALMASGYNEALLEFLRFIQDLVADAVPRELMMHLSIEEIASIRAQFIPFGGAGGSSSPTGPRSTPANRTTRRAQSRSTTTSR